MRIGVRAEERKRKNKERKEKELKELEIQKTQQRNIDSKNQSNNKGFLYYIIYISFFIILLFLQLTFVFIKFCINLIFSFVQDKKNSSPG